MEPLHSQCLVLFYNARFRPTNSRISERNSKCIHKLNKFLNVHLLNHINCAGLTTSILLKKKNLFLLNT